MLPAESANLITDPDYFAVIVFISPRSPQWPFVWALCQRAEGISEGKDYYAAAFMCKEHSIRILASICHITQDWKTAHLFVKQKEIAHIYSIKWLDCYFQSLKCDNSDAWCFDLTRAPRKIDDPINVEYTITININPQALAEKKAERIKYNELFICPCKQLANYNWGKFELPLNLAEQFQAFAVEKGVAECPNFNIDNFRPVYETINI